MLNKDVLKTSKAVFLIITTVSCYDYLIEWLNFIYCESIICKIKDKFYKDLKSILKFSFLGRITEEKERQGGAIILKNSISLRFFMNVLTISIENINKCLMNSRVFFSVQGLRKEFYFRPVKSIGFIGLTAALINMTLSVLLRKNISILGCFIWLSFILLGLCGFISNVEWHDLKRYSFVLNKLDRIKTNGKN